MARKPRIDSNSEASRIAAKAGQPIHPPPTVSLLPDELLFFANVVDEFGRSEWTAHSLEIAALLARTMCMLEIETRLLREEGSVAHSERGTPVQNPRVSVTKALAGDLLSYRRSLQLHSRAQNGDGRDTAKRRDGVKSVENSVRDGDDDGLLAKAN
jgi:hypothetical protein